MYLQNGGVALYSLLSLRFVRGEEKCLEMSFELPATGSNAGGIITQQMELQLSRNVSGDLLARRVFSSGAIYHHSPLGRPFTAYA